MKTLLFIILCIPFARKEKLPPITQLYQHSTRTLLVWDENGRTKAGDTLFLICSKFFKFKKASFVLMGATFMSDESTQLQYFTIGRFVAIRRKNELEISWD